MNHDKRSIKTKWDPDQYLKFSDERFRPAHDLIEQIYLQSPTLIYDLGCGTGHVTQALATRWPNANIIGIDSSEDMLNTARKTNSAIQWLKEDISTWSPKNKKPNLIFSNSTLHWLKDHKTLFENLFDALQPNGVLAIQMPNNFKEATHTTAFEIINNNPQWKNRLLPFLNFEPVHPANFYYDIFANLTELINIWETTYFHVLSGLNPVVEWVKGSFLRPLLEQMPPNDQKEFLEVYAHEISQHHPRQSNDKTILPFKRIFLIITKR